MKVGDLVRYTPDGAVASCWKDWYGIVVRCIPGTDERKVIMWSKDNNVRTTTKKSDLELVSESR
jgi:hypothetical protein